MHDIYGKGTIKHRFMNGNGEIGYEVYFNNLGKIVSVMNAGDMWLASPSRMQHKDDAYKSFAEAMADKLNSVKVIGGILDNMNPEEQKNNKHKSNLVPKDPFATEKRNVSSMPENVKRHYDIVMGLNELYAKKNADYGNSFHDTYVEEGMAMARIRLSDKLSRFKSLTKSKNQQVKDESVRDTLLDLANYAIMTVIEMDREKAK